MHVMLSGIVIYDNREQPLHPQSAMPLTFAKFNSPDKSVSQEITHPSTSVTPGMVVVFIMEEQFLKASRPMLFTLSGIVILWRFVSGANIPAPILVTVLPRVTVVIDEQPMKGLEISAREFTQSVSMLPRIVTFPNVEQLPKAAPPRVRTFLGIVTSVNPEQL